MRIDFLQNCPELPEVVEFPLDDMVAGGELNMVESIVSLEKISSLLLSFQDLYIINQRQR